MEWVVMNECIDSTMGRIHVCFLYCFLVTIRGLVGSFNWSEGRCFHLEHERVERNPDTVPFSDSKLQRVVVVLNWEGNASGARGREPCDYQRSLLFFCHASWFF